MKNFKLAVGDIVRIKSLEWFEENKKKAFDTEYVEVNGHVLTKEKAEKYCGRQVMVTFVIGNGQFLIEQGFDFVVNIEMVELATCEIESTDEEERIICNRIIDKFGFEDCLTEREIREKAKDFESSMYFKNNWLVYGFGGSHFYIRKTNGTKERLILIRF